MARGQISNGCTSRKIGRGILSSSALYIHWTLILQFPYKQLLDMSVIKILCTGYVLIATFIWFCLVLLKEVNGLSLHKGKHHSSFIRKNIWINIILHDTAVCQVHTCQTRKFSSYTWLFSWCFVFADFCLFLALFTCGKMRGVKTSVWYLCFSNIWIGTKMDSSNFAYSVQTCFPLN